MPVVSLAPLQCGGKVHATPARENPLELVDPPSGRKCSERRSSSSLGPWRRYSVHKPGGGGLSLVGF